MKQVKTIFCLLILYAGTVLLSGCTGTTPKSDFYQLNEMPNKSLEGVEQGVVIGIGPIQIAEYINRPQIVTRNSIHQLDVSEFHRWIEPLKDNINRVLMTNLSNHFNSNRVYWIPRAERHYPLELRISVDIRHFEGQLGKSAYLEAYWTIFDQDDKPLLSKVSLIEEPVKALDYEAMVEGMNRSLQSLGLEIYQTAKPLLNKK